MRPKIANLLNEDWPRLGGGIADIRRLPAARSGRTGGSGRGIYRHRAAAAAVAFGVAVSPKPNVLIVTLIGYSVAEVAGALAATLAMCGPSAVLACHVSRLLTRSGHSRRLNRGCLGFAGVV